MTVMNSKETAHGLLIELLAYQCAHSVKWIDIQDRLLSGHDAVSRLVELGPSKTLTGMAQKTIKAQVAAGGRQLNRKVECLASTQDISKVLYEYPATLSQDDTTSTARQEDINKALPHTETSSAAQIIAVAPARMIAAALEDTDVTGSAILRALIARKLRRPIAEISESMTLKDLCGGKSTLQNELVGDVFNEFGSLPERPEDLTIGELGLACGCSKELGKTSSLLLNKLVSAKLPAGFNLQQMRSHMTSTWGLGHCRQNAVFLHALANEPSKRLATAKAAEEYLERLATEYAHASGITLMTPAATTTQHLDVPQSVDPSVLAAASRGNIKLAQKQMKALAEYLAVDGQPEANMNETLILISELEAKLEVWTAEFSDEFLAGITPVFDTKKSRRYNSWWNTARCQVLEFFSKPAVLGRAYPRSTVDDFIRQMSSRTDASTVAIAEAVSEVASDGLETAPGLSVAARRIANGLAAVLPLPPRARIELRPTKPKSTVTADGAIVYSEIPRQNAYGPTAYVDVISRDHVEGAPGVNTFVSLKSIHRGLHKAEPGLTESLVQDFATALKDGVTFEDMNVLVTGAGTGSIGYEIVRILLSGGARVIVTTSREPAGSAKAFQQLYEDCAAKGSELGLLHFNQASVQDCDRLIDHIYSPQGLAMDLDAILPFAAAPEDGTDLDDQTAKNELVHRLMLVNIHRMLGRIVKNKRDRGIDSHPTLVLLPLSPNHGIIGGDGLYTASKMGLESLMKRVTSERWANELTICGVRMGWTRSTALMQRIDIVAEAIERAGGLTFTVQEMAFNVAMLLSRHLLEILEEQPLVADFDGGLFSLDNIAEIMATSRRELTQAAEIAKAVKLEDELEQQAALRPSALPITDMAPKAQHRSTMRVGFPRLPAATPDLCHLRSLQTIKDPREAVVVVGFSELGPCGSARLRWQLESKGHLTPSGHLEMAWLMDLVEHHEGPLNGAHYVGWIDKQSKKAVADDDIAKTYGEHILEHTGVRLMQPDNAAGYDPNKKEYLEEIAINDDLPEFETSAAAAAAFKAKHGSHVDVRPTPGTETCWVQMKRGASIMLSKTVPYSWGMVAGLIPTGWRATKYGIPEQLVQQLDPITIYLLCCASEAFFSAGITDPLEMFKHLHLSEFGNFVGSSMGGATKTQNMYKDVFLERQVQNDVLQDVMSNSPAAWVNMLLLGAAGPIKSPVGACATAIESIDSAMESISAGKTKMCIVGGVDDLHEDVSYGFSTMKATVNAAEELACGRRPNEMSRPTAESRAGFVESHGCGVQILCRGDVALEMGLPIYGIIAGSTMAGDKVSRSMPAPGQGLLTFAREAPEEMPQAWPSLTSHSAAGESESTSGSTTTVGSTPSAASQEFIFDYETPLTPPAQLGETWMLGGARLGGDANQSPQDKLLSPRPKPAFTSMSPFRSSLSKWGLTIDDIDVASLHGTSTIAGDVNEPEVICKQMSHLGRTSGKPMWAVCQKGLTGHPKGPAAAWMLNGCLQMLDSGLIPGNCNADNVDGALRKSEHLVFPSRSVQVRDIKAFMLTSFGFGQKGGQVVGVAPKYLYAMLEEQQYRDYRERVTKRTAVAERRWMKRVMHNDIVRVLHAPPYEAALADKILMDPYSRISEHQASGSYRFDANSLRGDPGSGPRNRNFSWGAQSQPTSPAKVLSGTDRAKTVARTLSNHSGRADTIGVDIVCVKTFDAWENDIFRQRNYTKSERAHAETSDDPRAVFASRWAAKESVFKCLCADSKGAGAAMIDIEVQSKNGAPHVQLHGDAAAAARKAGVVDVQVSISYEDEYIIAVALGVCELR